MNKAYGITASTFSELIDKINKFAETNKIFSTQFIEPDRNTFYCVVWYDNAEITQQRTPNKEFEGVNQITTEKIPNKPFRKPTDKMRYFLDKAWKIPEGQEYLKELGFDGNFELLAFDKAKDYISKIKTKQEES